MTLFANELSVHGQFESSTEFRDAFSQVMTMRNRAKLFGFEVYCSEDFLLKQPLEGMSMIEALQGFSRDRIRNAMVWLTKGPFMEDIRIHRQSDYLECQLKHGGEVVTDTSVGEAAVRKLNGFEVGLIGISPSNWDNDPVIVIWRREDEGSDDKSIEIPNWRDADCLEAALPHLLPKANSWSDLEEISRRHFSKLVFLDNCFDQLLKGVTFRSPIADRFVVLFGILDKLAREFSDDGRRTLEGHKIYRDFFAGDNAHFSDSSDTEKQDFKQEFTFLHPVNSKEKLFCTWHGKVSAQSMRFHFSWPIRSDEPVYIVYVGPKITKK